MQRGEVEFKWHDKRDVHVLSTVHTATMSASGKVDHLTGERKIKPDFVLDYNLKMGAEEKADMINSFVECAWNTTKWYKIFVHQIDTAALNGRIVHCQLTDEIITEQGKVITYQKYRENLMRELLEKHHTPRPHTLGAVLLQTIPYTSLHGFFPAKSLKLLLKVVTHGGTTKSACLAPEEGSRGR